MHDVGVAVLGCFKYNGREHGDLHFVGRLRPANELIAIVERERAQNARRELSFAAVQIVFAQNQTERLHGKKVAATSIAQDVSPTPGFLDSFVTATGDRRACAGINHDAVAMSERGGQS